MHVGMRMTRDPYTCLAGTATAMRADERLRERPCGVELARPRGADEQVGVRSATALDGALKKCPHARLRVELSEQRSRARLRRHLMPCHLLTPYHLQQPAGQLESWGL